MSREKKKLMKKHGNQVKNTHGTTPQKKPTLGKQKYSINKREEAKTFWASKPPG